MKHAWSLLFASLALASCVANPGDEVSSIPAEETLSSSLSSENSAGTTEGASSEEFSSETDVPSQTVEFLPQEFPQKENNTYPIGKRIEKDGVALECSYLMQGNQQRLDGVKEDVFQMKKGVGEIVSLQKVSGAITVTYLNKGEYTGNLVCYLGSSAEEMKTVEVLPPVLADETHYQVTYVAKDQYFALRNESYFAFYGVSLRIGGQA